LKHIVIILSFSPNSFLHIKYFIVSNKDIFTVIFMCLQNQRQDFCS